MIPTFSRCVRIGLALFGLWAGTLIARAEWPDALPGNWTMSDEAAALSDMKNRAEFRISNITPNKNDWSDGYFNFAWSGDTAASRGYYSLSTGRVWLTTRRYINGRQVQVEYKGGLKANGEVVWEGSASTTNTSPATAWSFVATKQ